MRRRIGSAASRGRARGSSFIELLVALTVLALMMIGTLQLFSLSLAVNKGASARTEMLLRCQQVVENIRYITYLNKNSFATPANTGVPYPLPNTIGPLPFKLPYLGTEPEYPYWGPDGANVITGARGPYKIFYFIESDNGTSTGMHVVTVTAVPAGSTEDPFPADPLPINKYFGVGPSRHLRVDYVAQF